MDLVMGGQPTAKFQGACGGRLANLVSANKLTESYGDVFALRQ